MQGWEYMGVFFKGRLPQKPVGNYHTYFPLNLYTMFGGKILHY